MKKCTKLLAISLAIMLAATGMTACSVIDTDTKLPSDVSSTVNEDNSNIENSINDDANSESTEESETSAETEAENNNASSEASDDASQEGAKEPTEYGLELFDFLVMTSCGIYGEVRGYSLDEVKDLFTEYKLTDLEMACDDPEEFDPTVKVTVCEKKDSVGQKNPCYVMRAIWEHPVLGKEYASMFFPIYVENFAELCDLLEIPENDLSQFRFTSDEIKAFGEKESELLTDVLKVVLRYKGLYYLIEEWEAQK